jgi:hypothetical protein
VAKFLLNTTDTGPADDTKVVVRSGKVALHAYGQGATLGATFVLNTEEDAYKLKAAVEALVRTEEEVNG